MSELRAMFVHGALRNTAPDLDRQIREANDFHDCFDSDAGQRVLREIIREAGILAVAHDPGDSRFYDGKRSLALYILEKLRWGIDDLTRRGITFEQLIARPEEQSA